MAFTTITGASGAPTTYTGTDGVDLITLVNPGATDLRGEAGSDFIGVNFTLATGTSTNVSLRGGQGTDTFQFTGAAGGTLISSFIAGNLGDDQMFTSGVAAVLTATTVQGGQGADAITVQTANGGSLINGNLGNDTLNIATAGTTTISSSSIFGGQGNDTITVGNGGLTSLSGVSIDGALGNDNIVIASLLSATSATVTGGDGNDIVNAGAAGANGGLVLLGGAGIDVITASASADTIDGGSGDDVINLRGGADLITLGSGFDVVDNLNGTYQGVAASAATIGAVGTALSISWSAAAVGPVIITDFSRDDILATGTTDLVTENLTALTANLTLVAGDNYVFRGNYSASTRTFTQSLTGNDVLGFVSTATTLDQAELTTDTNAASIYVLQGYGGQTLTTANFSA